MAILNLFFLVIKSELWCYFKYLGIEKMLLTVEKIVCWNCSAEIVQYFNENYKGKRGRCPICGVDFPLE